MGHTLYWSQAWPAEKNYVFRLYRKNCEIMSLCISLENFSFSGKKKVSRETNDKYQAWGFKLFKRGFWLDWIYHISSTCNMVSLLLTERKKHFAMGVLHGRGNRGEITRFVVKRLNVLLPATVTVMPHTTRSSLLIHSHDMVINDMIHHLITNHHEVLVFPASFFWQFWATWIFPSFILSQEGRPARWTAHWLYLFLLTPTPFLVQYSWKI